MPASYDPALLKLLAITVIVLSLMFSYWVSRGHKMNFSIPLLILALLGSILLVGRFKMANESLATVTSEATAERNDSTVEMWNELTAARIKLDDSTQAALASTQTATLSTQTASTTAVNTAERPQWVDAATSHVGNDASIVVSSEPFYSVDECYAQLEHHFLAEAKNHMKAAVSDDRQKKLLADTPAEELGITLEYVMREICKKEYTETVDSSVGEMKRVHVQMEFTPATEGHLLNVWQSQLRKNNLALVAKIAALVLACLGSVYGLLHIDTITRGYYTKRLIAGASAAIIAIVAALFVR